jgi:hypothetical protein
MCAMRSTRSPKSPLAPADLKRAPDLAISRLWIIMLVVILAACAKDVDPKADRSFLTNLPCAVPCWHGLALDQSSEAEVLATLATLEFVDPNDIREYPAPWAGYDQAQWVWFGCLHPAKRDCGVAALVDDKLKYLRLDVNYPLSLVEVVTKLGKPNYVDFGDYHAEVGGCGVRFFWPSAGIIVSYLDQRQQDVCKVLQSAKPISPELSITAVEYLSSEGFEVGVSGCCTRVAWPGLADQ